MDTRDLVLYAGVAVGGFFVYKMATRRQGPVSSSTVPSGPVSQWPGQASGVIPPGSGQPAPVTGLPPTQTKRAPNGGDARAIAGVGGIAGGFLVAGPVGAAVGAVGAVVGDIASGAGPLDGVAQKLGFKNYGEMQAANDAISSGRPLERDHRGGTTKYIIDGKVVATQAYTPVIDPTIHPGPTRRVGSLAGASSLAGVGDQTGTGANTFVRVHSSPKGQTGPRS